MPWGWGLLGQLHMSDGAGVEGQGTSSEAVTAGAAPRARATRAGPDPAVAASAPDGAAAVLQEEEGAAEGRGARQRRRASGPVSYSDGRRAPPSMDTKQRALQALCGWYHPDADHSTLKTKQQWAAEFGIDKRRFCYWEENVGEEMIDRLRRGVVPLPCRPPGPDGKARSYAKAAVASDETDDVVSLGFLHGYNLDELLKDLKARCNRVGDSRKYGSKGSRGLYREAVKWAVTPGA